MLDKLLCESEKYADDNCGLDGLPEELAWSCLIRTAPTASTAGLTMKKTVRQRSAKREVDQNRQGSLLGTEKRSFAMVSELIPSRRDEKRAGGVGKEDETRSNEMRSRDNGVGGPRSFLLSRPVADQRGSRPGAGLGRKK